MTSQTTRIPRLMLSTVLVLLASSCAPAQVDQLGRDAGPPPMPSAGTPLEQAKVPNGFNFEATQRVDIQLSAPESLPTGSAMTISRENGMVIFRGAVPASRSLTLAYPLPKHEHTLLVTYRTADGSEHTQTLQVSSDQTATSTMGQE